jgi:hypothetical protein
MYPGEWPCLRRGGGQDAANVCGYAGNCEHKTVEKGTNGQVMAVGREEGAAIVEEGAEPRRY